MSWTFTTPVTARAYETDSNGHIAGTVLMQYGQHARWEMLRSSGVDVAALARRHVGPVSLEESIKYHGEVRAGDSLMISCRYHWSGGKVFHIEQEIRKVDDDTRVASITNVGGLLDLDKRRLIADPADYLSRVAQHPAVLGL